jgi:hypothetical protein
MQYRITFSRIGRVNNPDPIVVSIEDPDGSLASEIGSAVMDHLETKRNGRRWLRSQGLMVDTDDADGTGTIYAGDRMAGTFTFERASGE